MAKLIVNIRSPRNLHVKIWYASFCGFLCHRYKCVSNDLRAVLSVGCFWSWVFHLAVGRFGHTENLWAVLVWAILVHGPFTSFPTGCCCCWLVWSLLSFARRLLNHVWTCFSVRLSCRAICSHSVRLDFLFSWNCRSSSIFCSLVNLLRPPSTSSAVNQSVYVTVMAKNVTLVLCQLAESRAGNASHFLTYDPCDPCLLSAYLFTSNDGSYFKITCVCVSVVYFGTNKKLICDFLSVIHSNHRPIYRVPTLLLTKNLGLL